jgi:precorrin-6A/cobalt-precorrin-6A reductase
VTGRGAPLSVLLLGGTAEARELAALLVADGTEVTTSLAGRLAAPPVPAGDVRAGDGRAGDVRVGGFGGVEGLRTAITCYDAVVDATHPFAEGMTANAAAA